MMKLLVLVSAFALTACVGDNTLPPDAMSKCETECSVVDQDPLTLPAGRCQAGNYDACVIECEERMPHGNYCPAP